VVQTTGAQDAPTEETTPNATEHSRELNLTGELPEFVEVGVPYGHPKFICPSCEEPIGTKQQINFAKPAPYAHQLNDVQKCPFCGFIFSYRLVTVRVIRQ